MSAVLGCLCDICNKCYQKYKSHGQSRSSTDPAKMADNNSPDTVNNLLAPLFTMVPLDSIFIPPIISWSTARHTYDYKHSFVQQTLFHPQQYFTESCDTSSKSSSVPAGSAAQAPSKLSRMSSYFGNAPLFSSSLSMKRPLHDTEQKDPSIEFIIYYDIQSRSLAVSLLTANNLPAKNSDRSSNPFVNLYLLPHKEEVFKSKAFNKNLNPIFNESFVFNHIPYHEINSRTLVLRVFNAKDTRQSHNNDELIGNVVLPLRKAELHGVRVSAVLNELQAIGNATTYGIIQLTLEYERSAGRVSGTVHKATNLKKMDYFGQSDPYVKINLLYHGKKKARWCSKVIKKTLSPVFDESFSFDISDMKIDEVGLKLCLKDEDVFGKDEVMGVVNFSKVCTHLTGWTHWRDSVANPGTRSTRWHSLECDTIQF